MATDQGLLISTQSPSVIAQCLCIGLSLPLYCVFKAQAWCKQCLNNYEPVCLPTALLGIPTLLQPYLYPLYMFWWSGDGRIYCSGHINCLVNIKEERWLWICCSNPNFDHADWNKPLPSVFVALTVFWHLCSRMLNVHRGFIAFHALFFHAYVGTQMTPLCRLLINNYLLSSLGALPEFKCVTVSNIEWTRGTGKYFALCEPPRSSAFIDF